MSMADAATPAAGALVGGGAYATGTNAGLILQSVIGGLTGFHLPIEIAGPLEFALVAIFSGFIHWAIRRTPDQAAQKAEAPKDQSE